jgi:hypothetical protein
MALPQYNTEELIDNIKRRCSVPTSQLTFQDADFVALANDELQGEVIPLIMSTREDYFVDSVDVTCPASGVIDFPDAAIGAKLKAVAVVQQDNPLTLWNLPRIDMDVVTGIKTVIAVSGFYITGNTLNIYPTPGDLSGRTIRIYFYKRSLTLATPADYSVITAIDTGTNTVSMSRLPTGWAANTQINSVSSVGAFNITNELATISSVAGLDIVLDNVTGMVVGDYLSGLGYSAVPQVPVEAHGYLAQLTAAKCLEGLGDREGMKAALDKAEKLRTSLMIVISQRVDGSVKKVMSGNGGLRVGAGLYKRRS